MWDSITSSIRLVEVLRASREGGASRAKMARIWAVVGAAAVCAVSHASILALSPPLALSNGTGCPFGRWIRSPTILARPDMTYSWAMAHWRTRWSWAVQKEQPLVRGVVWKKVVVVFAFETGGAGV